MQRVSGNRIIAVAYAIIGLGVSIATCSRIWDEGILGNDSGVLFFSIYGPTILFGALVSALLLTAGQVGRLLDMTNGLLVSRMSLVLFILVLALEFKRGHIWSYWADFVVFSSVAVLVYLPVIIQTSSIVQFPKNVNEKASS